MSDEQSRSNEIHVLTDLPRPPKRPLHKRIVSVIVGAVLLFAFGGGVNQISKAIFHFLPWLGSASMLVAFVVVSYPIYLFVTDYREHKKEDERTLRRYRWELQRLTRAACDTIDYGDYPNLDPLISALNEIRELEDP